MNWGVIAGGLFVISVGITGAVAPQRILDIECQIDPRCESPGMLSSSGRTFNRFVGTVMAFLGLLFVFVGL
jgi:hypothetical protein